MSVYASDITIMIRAAEKAARSLNRDFGEVERLQVSKKGPGDFVTAADKRAEKIIKEDLIYARPDYSLLMEEEGKIDGKKADHRWIVDPLDGTRNFMHGLPHWSISIALEVKGEIVAGIVHDPVKDELFKAEKNQGAFMGRQRLRVSARTQMDEALIAHGGTARLNAKKRDQFYQEYTAVQGAQGSMRRFGSAALDLAYVAAGRFDGYWERNLSSWDVAAGMLILRESGGFVCDIDDDRANPVETAKFIAGNEAIYGQLKTILRGCA